MGRVFQEHQLINWFTNGILMPERTIMLENDSRDFEDNSICAMTASRLIRNISTLEVMDDEAPILIIMNDCPGGEVTAGMSMFDRIKASPCHVTMRVYGACWSMATVVLQAADERQLAPNVSFMIHDGTDGVSEVHPKVLKAWGDEAVRMCKRTYQIYHERMKEKDKDIILSRIERMCTHDRIMTAEQAVEQGLADKIYRGKQDN